MKILPLSYTWYGNCWALSCAKQSPAVPFGSPTYLSRSLSEISDKEDHCQEGACPFQHWHPCVPYTARYHIGCNFEFDHASSSPGRRSYVLLGSIIFSFFCHLFFLNVGVFAQNIVRIYVSLWNGTARHILAFHVQGQVWGIVSSKFGRVCRVPFVTRAYV